MYIIFINKKYEDQQVVTCQIHISFKNIKSLTTCLIGNNSTLTIEKRFLKGFTAVKCYAHYSLYLEVTELLLKYDKA